nr:glucan endo-1,3-alpha-glucosidase agn1 [Quercus suber]
MLAFAAVATLVVGLVSDASATAVLAHFMVQNSYAYDLDQWKTDMNVAKGIGIDGFALNWIAPDCQPGLDWTAERIDDAYTAAEQVGFKLVHSFDMSIAQCDVHWNQTYMRNILERNAGSSAAYRWNSNLLVTTYGGDMVQQYGNDFFQGLKDDMKSTNPITLAPALTKYSMAGYDDPTPQANKIFRDFPAIDGYVNWQAWPLNKDQAISVAPDKAFQSALRASGKTGPYVMSSDTLFPTRFEQITSDAEVQPDIIELLTWNDFCESHYLRDLPGKDKSAKDHVELGHMGHYVWGQSHSAWRIIAKYYISWWKTGSAPEITQDQVVFWHRTHPKAAVCEHSPASGIKNALFPADAVFAWAVVTSPATISMSIGSNQYWTFHADNTGPVMGSIPFPNDLSSVGATPEVAVMRNGALKHWAKSSKPVKSNCSWQNFNPVVGLAGNNFDLLVEATTHPFLSAAATFSLAESQLKAWLAQDRLYALSYISFIGTLLSRTSIPTTSSREDSLGWRCADLLIDCLTNIRREIRLFEDAAREEGWFREICDGVEPSVQTRAYQDLFAGATAQGRPLIVGLTVLWATEDCYGRSWKYAAAQTVPHLGAESRDIMQRVFIPNWSSTEFRAFVEKIRAVLDEYGKLLERNSSEWKECEIAYRQVLWAETQFWPKV